MFIGERIRELRLENNLLQKELASNIRIASNTLSQFESGKANPSYDVLISIADFFGCTTDYLLGREDDFGIIQTKTPGESYTREERQLVEDYRALAPDLQEMILATIRTWKSTEANEERKRKTS